MVRSKLNENMIEKLCDARKSGLSVKDCAYVAGIGKATLYRWIEKGKKSKRGKYHEFYLNWEKSEVEFRLYHIKKINESKDWRASQYMLTVSDPERYNTNKYNIKQETTIKDRNVVKLDNEALEKLLSVNDDFDMESFLEEQEK